MILVLWWLREKRGVSFVEEIVYYFGKMCKNNSGNNRVLIAEGAGKVKKYEGGVFFICFPLGLIIF